VRQHDNGSEKDKRSKNSKGETLGRLSIGDTLDKNSRFETVDIDKVKRVVGIEVHIQIAKMTNNILI